MKRTALPLFLFALSLSASLANALAQTQANESDPCAANTGDASGAGACFAAQLDAAETKLVALEAESTGAAVGASNDPPAAKRLALAEAKAWREYRRAKCDLYGETQGGSDRWKSAFATSCEVAESNARIESFRKALGRK